MNRQKSLYTKKQSRMASMFKVEKDEPSCFDKCVKKNKETKVSWRTEEEKKERIGELWAKVRTYVTQVIKFKRMTKLTAEKLAKGTKKTYLIKPKPVLFQKLILPPDALITNIINSAIGFLTFFEILSSNYILFVQDVDKRTYAPSNVTTVFLTIHIVTNFFKGYKKDIRLILDIKTISWKYLKSYFVIDFLATIPLYLWKDEFYVLRLLRILRFTNCFHIVTSIALLFSNYFQLFNKSTIKTMARIAKLGLNISLITHIIACIWVYLGKQTAAWIDTKYEGNYLSDKDDTTIYVASIYWVLTTFTTVGYGDITGSTSDEWLFQMLIQMIGIIFFAYLMGNINELVEDVARKSHMLMKEQEDLEQWMMQLDRAYPSRRLPPQVFVLITDFFEEFWIKDMRSIQNEEFFHALNPIIRKKLMNYLFAGVRGHFEALFNPKIFHPECVQELILNMGYHRYERLKMPGMVLEPIIRAGTKPKFVFFLVSGEINVTSIDNTRIYLKLKPGSIFGEISALYDIPSTYNYSFEEFEIIEVLKVLVSDFVGILSKYEYTYEMFEKITARRRRFMRQSKINAINIANQLLAARNKTEPRGNEEEFSEADGMGGNIQTVGPLKELTNRIISEETNLVRTRKEGDFHLPDIHHRDTRNSPEFVAHTVSSPRGEIVSTMHSEPLTSRLEKSHQTLKSPDEGVVVNKRRPSCITNFKELFQEGDHMLSLNVLDIIAIEQNYNSEEDNGETEKVKQTLFGRVKYDVEDQDLSRSQRGSMVYDSKTHLKVVQNKMKDANNLLSQTEGMLSKRIERLSESIAHVQHQLDIS